MIYGFGKLEKINGMALKVLAKKCEDCPYDLTCSMKKIVNHKIPCYADENKWIFKLIKKFGKDARVSEEMYK